MTAAVGFLGLALTLVVPPPQAAAAESQALQAERQAIRERETKDLIERSATHIAAGRQAEAAAILALVEPAPPPRGPFHFVPLREVDPARKKATTNAGVEAAVAEVQVFRARAARELVALAIKALGGPVKHYAIADGCLRAVLVRDPDNAEARRLLGYVPHDGGWATPFAVEQFKLGKKLHATYGWVDASWIPHLENGQLPARGMTKPKDVVWLPAATADAQRDSIEHGWRIATEHFEIVADVPLSEAIAFGRKVELFHDLNFSVLADVVGDALPVARRFRDKGSAQPQPAAHTIHYFATKEEYLAALRARGETDLENSLGIYIPPKSPGVRRAPAYFFRDTAGAIDVTATLFHEVSHQLLLESAGVPPTAFRNNKGNFWVFEGLGTYFETVVVQPDNSLLYGGYVGPRIEAAQRWMLENNETVPLERLVKLNQNNFIDLDLHTARLHYGQSMALTVYLMEGRGGKYRDDFFDYVRDALRGRFRNDSGRQLDDRLGISYTELRAEFLADLKPR